MAAVGADKRAGSAADSLFDPSLLRRAQAGDPDALEGVAREAWGPSFVLARAVLGDEATAQDVAQEAVLAALRGLDRFDASRPFAPWLHRITLNRCRDQQRRAAARPLPTDAEPAAAVEARSTALPSELVAALMSLTVEQRAAVVLKHLFGLSAVEIATSLETTEVNARTLVHRGLNRLREQLQEINPAEEASA